jgi:short-subunit dehydrogenase
MRPLGNRVVLITGGSRGIGAELARAFGREGATVAISARSEDELERTRKDLDAAGVRAVAVAADVTHLDSLRRLVAEVTRSCGPIDVLVNNAAAGESILEFQTIDPDVVERTFRTNVLGMMWLTQLVLPSMLERGEGHIVNMSSQAGIVPVPYNTLYAATKHAVVGFSRSLRGEVGHRGVGVSVVCPTFVRGERIEHNFDGREPPRQSGTVTEPDVAKAVIDAVLNDRGDVFVVKGLGKISDVAVAVAPELFAKAYKRMGVFEFFKRSARANAERVKD